MDGGIFLAVHQGWKFSSRGTDILIQKNMTDGCVYSRKICEPDKLVSNFTRRYWCFSENLYLVNVRGEIYEISIDFNIKPKFMYKYDNGDCLLNIQFVHHKNDRLVVSAYPNRLFCVTLDGKLLWDIQKHHCYGAILKDSLYVSDHCGMYAHKISLDGKIIERIRPEYCGRDLAGDGTFLYSLCSTGVAIIPHDKFVGEPTSYRFLSPSGYDVSAKVIGYTTDGIYVLVHNQYIYRVQYTGITCVMKANKDGFFNYHSNKQIKNGKLYCSGCELCKTGNHEAPIEWKHMNSYYKAVQNHIERAASFAKDKIIGGRDFHIKTLKAPGKIKEAMNDVRETFKERPLKLQKYELTTIAEEKIAIALVNFEDLEEM